jgi:hypothetical protein
MPAFLIRFGAWFARLVGGSSAATNAAIGLAAGEGVTVTANSIWNLFTGNPPSEEDPEGFISGGVNTLNDLKEALKNNFGFIGLLLTLVLILAFWKQINKLIR